MKNEILEVIKEESEQANVRKYTCINGFGYSQFERNLADSIVTLIRRRNLLYYVGGVISGSLILLTIMTIV